MPGFDKSRFKNLTKNESDSLTCGICLGILCDPNITICCGQAYCHDCIKEWLKSSKTCPNDRKSLSWNQLLPAPLLVNNMLNNSMIDCQYFGCLEVQTIELIEQHELNCWFNPEAICIDCLTKNGNRLEHDCVNNLKQKLHDTKQNNEELKNANILLNIESTYEISHLNKKLNTIKFQLNKKISKESNMISQIKSLESKMLKYQNENKKLNLSMEEIKCLYANLKCQNNKQSLSNLNVVKDNNLLKEQSTREIKNLQNKLSDEIAVSTCMLTKIKKFETEISERIKYENTLQKQIEELILSNDSLANSIFQNEKLKQSNEKLIQGYKSSNEQSVKEISRLNNEIKKIDHDLKGKTIKENLLLNRIKNCEEKINNTNQQLESLNLNIKESHAQFDESKNQQNLLNAYIQELEKDNEKLKSVLRKKELICIGQLLEKSILNQKITKLEHLPEHLEKTNLKILMCSKEIKESIEILGTKDNEIKRLRQIINILNFKIKGISNVSFIRF